VILTDKKKFAAKCEALKFPLCNGKNDLTHKNTGKRYYAQTWILCIQMLSTFECITEIPEHENPGKAASASLNIMIKSWNKNYFDKKNQENRQNFAIYILLS